MFKICNQVFFKNPNPDEVLLQLKVELLMVTQKCTELRVPAWCNKSLVCRVCVVEKHTHSSFTQQGDTNVAQQRQGGGNVVYFRCIYNMSIFTALLFTHRKIHNKSHRCTHTVKMWRHKRGGISESLRWHPANWISQALQSLTFLVTPLEAASSDNLGRRKESTEN